MKLTEIGPSRLAFMAMAAGVLLNFYQIFDNHTTNKIAIFIRKWHILGWNFAPSHCSNDGAVIILLFRLTFIVCTFMSYGWFSRKTTKKISNIYSRIQFASYTIIPILIILAICYEFTVQICGIHLGYGQTGLQYFAAVISPILLQGMGAVGGMFFAVLIFAIFSRVVI